MQRWRVKNWWLICALVSWNKLLGKVSDRNTGEKCLQMKDYLEVLISELNSIQLILHEDIKSTSAGSWNLT